jgi:Na+-transporting NADH:ubiquinone oxidoreductase subunit NqrC
MLYCLKIDGKLVDDENQLLSVWQKHYEDLYTPKEAPDFDEDFKAFVESKLTDYSSDRFKHQDPL